MFVEPEKIIDCLQKDYGLPVQNLEPLALGADFNSAVYKATTNDSGAFFVKLRRGDFDSTSVRLPMFLSQMGLEQIIPVIQTHSGDLWCAVGGSDCNLIMYPLVDGKDGYEQRLSPQNWADFAKALKQLHSADVPAEITQSMRKETFDIGVCDGVNAYLGMIEQKHFADPVANELAIFLKAKRDDVLQLLNRTSRLAPIVKSLNLPFVVCHSDLHAGNLLIQTDRILRIVDWDTPIMAPKERDLMYVGGALLASGLATADEEKIFYKSYGLGDVSQVTLAYYRCERIVQDIFEYCKELLGSNEGSAEERAQSLAYLKANFEPGRTIEAAYRFEFGESD